MVEFIPAMTAQSFGKSLIAAGFTAEEFNSNNSWGFGGAVGTRYTMGTTVIKIATASCRHADSTQFITVTRAGRRVYDELQSAKAFKLVLSKEVATISA